MAQIGLMRSNNQDCFRDLRVGSMCRSQRWDHRWGPLVIPRKETAYGARVPAAWGEASSARHGATPVLARRGRGETLCDRQWQGGAARKRRRQLIVRQWPTTANLGRRPTDWRKDRGPTTAFWRGAARVELDLENMLEGLEGIGGA
ncbi:hypothetical protein E2562_033146 [Oryza meyeriana var. granulata]|uniref:Uncharacterized protein n=1 Tax=Oryza meyeriana var. granulata TaxID=110450 RepID=A0A6G1CKH3_9ORYZ|nr:hypothetical protein E2562_033146 [Oryza meyeriana var. granulata]